MAKANEVGGGYSYPRVYRGALWYVGFAHGPHDAATPQIPPAPLGSGAEPNDSRRLLQSRRRKVSCV